MTTYVFNYIVPRYLLQSSFDELNKEIQSQHPIHERYHNRDNFNDCAIIYRNNFIRCMVPQNFDVLFTKLYTALKRELFCNMKKFVFRYICHQHVCACRMRSIPRYFNNGKINCRYDNAVSLITPNLFSRIRKLSQGR